MPLLADASAQFNGNALAYTAIIVSIVGTVAVIIFGIIGIARRQPSVDAQFATKQELGELKGEIRENLTNLRSELREDFKSLADKLDERLPELSTDNERRAVLLHNRLNEHENRIARLEGRANPHGA